MCIKYMVRYSDAHMVKCRNVLSSPLILSFSYTVMDILVDVPPNGLVTDEEIDHGGKCGHQHHGKSNSGGK